jgi:hypothetical protein
MNISYSPDVNKNITSICSGATSKSMRVYNESTVVLCCNGPLLSKSVIQAPMTLESCSKNVIPHKRLVNYNGRLLELTVVTYNKCET